VTKTLSYYDTEFIVALKGFLVKPQWCKLVRLLLVYYFESNTVHLPTLVSVLCGFTLMVGYKTCHDIRIVWQ
jgi:hypothetical protein